MVDVNDFELEALMVQCATIMAILNDLSADVGAIRDGIRQHNKRCHFK
jgi:hypothetical protein